MKKFLTVLLALSVVFTYTVGTAFATDTTYQEDVEAAAKLVQADFDAKYDTAVAAIDSTDASELEIGGKTVEAKYWKEAAAIWKAEKDTNLQLRKDEVIEKNFSDLSVTDLKAKFTETVGYTTDAVPTNIKFYNGAPKVKEEVAKAKFAAVKAEAERVIGLVAIDGVYSTTLQEIKGVTTSHYAIAKAIVDEALASVKSVKLAKTYSDADFAAKLGEIGETATNGVGGSGSGYLGVIAKFPVEQDFYEIYKIRQTYANGLGLKTIAEEGGIANTLEAAKIEKNARIDSIVARFLKEHVNDADYTKVVKPLAEAYSMSQKYLVEAAEKIEDLNKVLVGNDTLNKVNDAYFKVNVDAIKELERFAAKFKLEKDATGKLIRDAEAVDEIVEAAKLEAYATVGTWTGLDAAKAAIVRCTIANAKDAFTIEKAKYDVEQLREATLEDYYDLEAAEVNAKFDEVIAAIDAAPTTAKALEAANKALATGALDTLLKDIRDKDAVQRKVASLDEYDVLFAKLVQITHAENAGLTGDARKDYNFFNDAYLKNYIGEAGARNGAEVAALYPQLKAELEAVKTIAEVKEAVAVVDALIDALPDAVKLTDAAAVEAAWNAAKALEKVHPNAVPTKDDELADAISQLADAEKYAVEKEIYDLNQIAEPTEEQVQAVLDKVTAFNDKFEEDEIFEDVAPSKKIADSAITRLQNKLDAFRADALEAVIDAIKAIPLNVTLADKATVEAARAAYDAFVAKYNCYDPEYDAVSYVTNKQVLFLAEAAIEAAEKEALEAQIAAVKGMQVVKCHSTAGKGYIKVMWDVVGDETAIDGFQVYKSTKAQSGYTFMGKTTKHYMTNKKGLKKGKRFYYKVRAYKVIDGTKYFSDWSNKANRIAK